MRRFKVTMKSGHVVEVTVHDPDVFERVTGPKGDEWRASMYDLHTEREVLEMLADNCVRGRVKDVSDLDGWADLPKGAATMEVVKEPWGVVERAEELAT